MDNTMIQKLNESFIKYWMRVLKLHDPLIICVPAMTVCRDGEIYKSKATEVRLY